MFRFKAVIQIRGVNPYVTVEATLACRLRPGWREPLPVMIQVNGEPKEPWHINLMPAGDGSFYLYLHEKVRKASGTQVGDRVTVAIAPDLLYRGGPQGQLPRSFRSALRANSKARDAWKALPPSRQKEIVRYLASLKSAEAKARNLEKVLTALSGRALRFMGRSWRKGK